MGYERASPAGAASCPLQVPTRACLDAWAGGPGRYELSYDGYAGANVHLAAFVDAALP